MNRKRPRRTLEFDALAMAAECLKTLAHPHRLQIVQLLLEGELYTVSEIAEAFDLPQPTTSDHLRLMQRCGFLRSTKEGRTVYYEIAEPHLQDIMNCMQNRFG